MDSISNLFIVGPGPSSSHTIGPFNAAIDFKNAHLDAKSYKVVLYGSLALTGKGHLTDFIIDKAFEHNVEISFNYSLDGLTHPNTMDFFAIYENNSVIKQRYFSIGGGSILKEGDSTNHIDIYPFKTFKGLKDYMNKMHFESIIQVVDHLEDKIFLDQYLKNILDKMFFGIENGLNINERIPGKLKLERVASNIYKQAIHELDPSIKKQLLITSFAYAQAENNASGYEVVTSPTCGSCGIVPAVLYYEYKFNNISYDKLILGLKVAGLIGNIVKYSWTISGAVGGCQAEVGVATSMASVALGTIYNFSFKQIEYAAEVALEHNIGLTCDPVQGYVQIPCIERNGLGALRAYDAMLYAKYISLARRNRISFDEVVEAMKLTGDDLNSSYKETSLGGLAKVHKEED